MKKVRYNNTFIYIDDTPLDPSETGVLTLPKDEELEKTIEIDPINDDNEYRDNRGESDE